MLITFVTYLLHISTDPNKFNLSDLAFMSSVIALIMFVIQGVQDYMTERKSLKAMTRRAFVNNQLAFYQERIGIVEEKMNRATESYEAIQEVISKIDAELRKRECNLWKDYTGKK